jgi:hypothetical protein
MEAAVVSAYLPGLELSRHFCEDAVLPILETEFPGLPHSAALIGRGSEVLGYDDEMSADHNCEARVVIFLRDEDHASHGSAVDDALRQTLPPRFSGRPTYHEVATLRGYVREHLDFDLDSPIEAGDWLTFQEQQLLMLTAGAVYHDEIGLQELRERFNYYPHDVWLYLLLAGWWRVHPEANLVGRTGFVGDELGSAVIGSRIVLDFMRLCFLMERQYAPYPKWLGTAFSRLACGTELSPVLRSVLRAETWLERESALTAVYEKTAAMHNKLGITEPVPTEVCQLWDRPFKVLWGDFPGFLSSRIQDPAVRHLAEQWPAGGIDEFRHLLLPPQRRRLLRRVFE